MLQYWTSASYLTNALLTPTKAFLFTLSCSKQHPSYQNKYNLTGSRKPRRPSCLLNLGVENIAEIAHNKVVVAAGVSAAIGQLSKPFTSVLLYGKDFDFKAAFQAGGFPSTHSSAVVATATCLALERGFSDSLFGLSLVYAGLVMYDAQGVRREVGDHAGALNNILSQSQVDPVISENSDGLGDSQQLASSTSDKEKLGHLLSEEGRPFVPNSTNAPLLLRSDGKRRQTSRRLVSSSFAAAEEKQKTLSSSAPMKESIGHTEVEVVAGALLGLLVSMAVHMMA